MSLALVKRGWFLFSLWTGIVSLEGLEYYILAPLSVIAIIGMPTYVVFSILSLVLAWLTGTASI